MTPQIKQRIDQIRRGEVPEGYKRTKVGVVPEEWEITKLYLISSHVTKKNTNGEVQTTFTNSATQGVIKQTDYFDKEISNKENITSYYVVQENDYIYNPRISVSAPCGPINKSHFSENGVVSPLYTVFRLNDVFQKNKYIEFFFKSSFWHSYMCGIANYGARHDRMNITNDDLFGMPIPFPPLAEQEKIAEILQTQDKVIALQQKKIDELKKLKKVYLSKMFPKKGCNVPEIRFPGFTDPWEQRTLGEFGTITTGNTPSTAVAEYYSDDGIVWVTPTDISENITYETEKKLSKLGQQIGRVVPKNTILVTCIASIGKNTMLGNTGSFNQQINGLTPNENKYEPYFLLTESALWSAQMKKSAAAGTMQIVNRTEFSKLKTWIPTLDEQKQIGSYFRNLDSLITLHQRKLEEEQKKKKALMQLLLTGIVRVA